MDEQVEAQLNRYYDGDRLLEDVTQALELALSKHGLATHSLLGVTTAIEAIASALKFQHLQGVAGRQMGRLGLEAYKHALLARQIALLQSPHSTTVNSLMECIAVALARGPIADTDLERATLQVFLRKSRLSQSGVAKAHRENSSLAPAFLSARGYLEEAQLIARTVDGSGWHLT